MSNTIQELLKMDMGACIEWLIDNQYDFDITPTSKSNKLKKAVFENMDTLLEKGSAISRLYH